MLFKIPDYLTQIGMPWHAHFINHSKTIGGHVFDLNIKSAIIEIMPLEQINIILHTQRVSAKYESEDSLATFHQVVEQAK